MSVRMALAKLCACTCGGAIIGGGAVHVAERPHPVRIHHVVRRVVRQTIAPARLHRVVTTTRTSCPAAVVTVASQGAPIPVPQSQGFALGSSGVVGPALIGGTGGVGFGNGFGAGFGGGFFGGTSGGNAGIVVSSTSSSSSSSSGNVSSSTGGLSSSSGNVQVAPTSA